MAQRILTDKVIVITGASSGIGEATAIACAKAGMHVVLAARRKDKLAQVAQAIQTLGRQALAITCDVTCDADVDHLFAQAFEHMGRVDVLFANAGYGLFLPVLDTPDDEHRAIFETNYFGTLRTLRSGVPYLRQTPQGLKHILVCSSSASEIGVPMMGAYCATKAAQDSIVSALRAELANEGTHVTGIHPVGTRTNFVDVAAALSQSPRQKSNTPVALMQTSEDVARAIVRALRRPRPEVWPMSAIRFALALGTAFPRFAAWIMRRHARKIMP